MRASIKKEFGKSRPRAIVLDDSANARSMTAHRLRNRGFEVVEFGKVADFVKGWKPGLFDVIIADWDLSHDEAENGDRVLEGVRRRDWDVPFVLVSGKLDQSATRAQVLQDLLKSGGARFVQRGDNGISRACDHAEDLIERRDLTLLKVILSLRPAALSNQVVVTSSGRQSVQELLESIVAKPKASHDAERPISTARAARYRAS